MVNDHIKARAMNWIDRCRWFWLPLPRLYEPMEMYSLFKWIEQRKSARHCPAFGNQGNIYNWTCRGNGWTRIDSTYELEVWEEMLETCVVMMMMRIRMFDVSRHMVVIGFSVCGKRCSCVMVMQTTPGACTLPTIHMACTDHRLEWMVIKLTIHLITSKPIIGESFEQFGFTASSFVCLRWACVPFRVYVQFNSVFASPRNSDANLLIQFTVNRCRPDSLVHCEMNPIGRTHNEHLISMIWFELAWAIKWNGEWWWWWSSCSGNQATHSAASLIVNWWNDHFVDAIQLEHHAWPVQTINSVLSTVNVMNVAASLAKRESVPVNWVQSILSWQSWPDWLGSTHTHSHRIQCTKWLHCIALTQLGRIFAESHKFLFKLLCCFHSGTDDQCLPEKKKRNRVQIIELGGRKLVVVVVVAVRLAQVELNAHLDRVTDSVMDSGWLSPGVGLAQRGNAR